MSDTAQRSNNRSSVVANLSPEKRKCIDRAIINRSLPTYKEMYERADLAADGITYMSFWRYASRLRRDAELHNLAELTCAQDMQLPLLMPRLILHKLFAALTHEEADPAAVQKLVHCYSAMLKSRMALEDWRRNQIRRGLEDDGDEDDAHHQLTLDNVWDEFARARGEFRAADPEPAASAPPDLVHHEPPRADDPAQIEPASPGHDPVAHERTCEQRSVIDAAPPGSNDAARHEPSPIVPV